MLNWRFLYWTDGFLCWTDKCIDLKLFMCFHDVFVLNWRFNVLNWQVLTWSFLYVLMTYVCWTDAFCMLNWQILGAEKGWPFYVELMCWSYGCVELSGSLIFKHHFVNWQINAWDIAKSSRSAKRHNAPPLNLCFDFFSKLNADKYNLIIFWE